MSVKLLSDEEIKSMRGALDIDRYRPPSEQCLKEWDVYRIVATLEHLAGLDKHDLTEEDDRMDKAIRESEG